MMIALRYLIESLTILLLLLASGCHTYKDTEGYGPASKASSTGVWRFDFNDSLGFVGRDTVWNEYAYNGVRTPVEGRVAVDNTGKARLLRIGHWKDFSAEGQLLREGEYAIGRYLNCCSHGPCSDFYNYRLGKWTFWYPNGQVRARGEFIPRRRNLDTSCKGGDWLWFGEINPKNWEFYSEDGIPSTPSSEELLLLERVVFDLGKYAPLVTLGRWKNDGLSMGLID